jgi:putative CocE/NonD family hydrolase
VNRRISVRMRDGVRLRTDHYAPDLPGAPTVLVRTPYGLGAAPAVMARTIAEQGFHVVMQSCRGTFDSEGEFEPMRHERADGLDTLDWLRAQPWYSGELCTFGPSYVGFVQWAIAAEAGPELKAMATVVTASDFRQPTYAGGTFALDTVLTWAALMEAQRGSRWANFMELRRGQPRLQRGLAHLPLGEADLVATGAPQAFVREWLAEPGDDYWAERGHATRLGEVTAAVLMVGGWHDIFLPWQLVDYAALRAAGVRPRLVVGPWTHGSFGLYRASVREAVAWFKRQTRPEVRVHVGGADEWRTLVDWPPQHRSSEWVFKDGGPADRFRYDPADPTPAVGGPRLVANVSGRRDNRDLEARPDVLVYTGGPLAAPVEVIGPVTAIVDIEGDSGNFDVFVRLCDVDARGRSWNVCDGLIRVTPGTPRPVEVALWPTAYRFAAGHRIRVQVSGGAHPRFARNTGTGEALASGTALRPVHLAVHGGTLLLPLPDRENA